MSKISKVPRQTPATKKPAMPDNRGRTQRKGPKRGGEATKMRLGLTRRGGRCDRSCDLRA
jgi:hypothetical protein